MIERGMPADWQMSRPEPASREPTALNHVPSARPSAPTRRTTLPPWEPAAGRLLLDATRRIQVIGWTTPTNLRAELARLCRDWSASRARPPRFEHASRVIDRRLGAELARASRRWSRLGPLGELYAARAQELGLELELGAAIGTPRLRELANRRYRPRDRFDRRSDRLCASWLAEPIPSDRALPRVRSDDESDPRSLLRRLRAEVTTHLLHLEVVATDRLAALAAIGDDAIYVARGRELAPKDVQRTVLHEIHGHALPRQRARQLPLALFACGTAWGSDDQEGRALWLEQEAGLLCPARRRELALRHVAARSAEQGATFVETARALERYPVSLFDRLRIAARVHRGGGLARERAYVPAYLRVRAAHQSDPSIDATLRTGRIAVDVAEQLRPWVG